MKYINTDVDLHSKGSLERLGSYLEERSDLLHCGQLDGSWNIRIEAAGSGIVGSKHRHPESDIKKLILLLKEAKALFPGEFNALEHFEFNIGLNAPLAHPAEVVAVSCGILTELSELGACLGVTVYPAEQES